MGVPATVRVRISASHTWSNRSPPPAVIALDGEFGDLLPSDLGAFGGECKKGGGAQGTHHGTSGPGKSKEVRRVV